MERLKSLRPMACRQLSRIMIEGDGFEKPYFDFPCISNINGLRFLYWQKRGFFEPSTCRPVINRGKRQKAPGLAGMSASSRQTAHPRCVIVLSECDCLAHQTDLPSTMVSCEPQFNAYGYPP